MAYVENQTIHDADSHVMEMPTTITEYMSKDTQAKFEPYIRHKDPAWIDEIVGLHDNANYMADAEAEIMTRRGHHSLGAFRNNDRVKTLDYLGFASQLVFTTDALDNYGLETGQTNSLACATARAHNRMMTDFCSIDRRLLATGYVPLVDMEEAPRIAKEALEMGCNCLLYTSPSPRDKRQSRMPSSA